MCFFAIISVLCVLLPFLSDVYSSSSLSFSNCFFQMSGIFKCQDFLVCTSRQLFLVCSSHQPFLVCSNHQPFLSHFFHYLTLLLRTISSDTSASRTHTARDIAITLHGEGIEAPKLKEPSQYVILVPASSFVDKINWSYSSCLWVFNSYIICIFFVQLLHRCEGGRWWEHSQSFARWSHCGCEGYECKNDL